MIIIIIIHFMDRVLFKVLKNTLHWLKTHKKSQNRLQLNTHNISNTSN